MCRSWCLYLFPKTDKNVVSTSQEASLTTCLLLLSNVVDKQVQLDALRKKLNAPREAIRDRYLAKERAKVEPEVAPIEPVASGK